MKKIILSFFIIILSFSTLFALETRNGQIKIVLDEEKGTFSIYKIATNGGEDLTFFVDEDTRTSSIFMLIDNRVYRMGQNSGFTQSSELTENGARYIWENPAYKAILDFSFISSTGGTYSDGVKLNFSVENLSSAKHNIGVRILLDTYLGEDNGIHFNLPDTEIKKETELKGSFPAWWKSDFVQVMMNSRGSTPPERVVFANWKRLNENSWFYESRSNRNFNLLPYSINDSAVSHYYEIKALEAGGIREINLYMGLLNDKGFQEMTARQSSAAAEPIVNVDSGDQYNFLQAIQVDLIQVNKVLEEIETVISEGDDIDDETLLELKAKVDELKERQSRYLVE
ncbi:MAG: hypothetical protein JEY99_00220 [Spirochaetales bacterium]|nr:hypothetical protein [Spirochaetales bacterium]